MTNQTKQEKEYEEKRKQHLDFIQSVLDTRKRLGLKSNSELLKMDYQKEIKETINQNKSC